MENLPVTREIWKGISLAAEKDPVMIKLKDAVLTSWNNYKEVDDSIKSYYQFKDEIVMVGDLLFRGDRIIIPQVLRHDMLIKLHTGHPGVSRMTSRAEITMFWPGINQDIKKFVNSCPVCLKYQDNKQKCVLKYKKVPKLPWQEVGCDIFELNQKQYLVVVDALSNYIEVCYLNDLRSATVINKLKSIFARHGIPVVLYSDGGLCFDSELFKKFEKEWSFVHVLSSPHYPKSNGLAESAVKTVKKIFKKCAERNEDPLLALLNHRNTPRTKVHSPASNLMGRQLRTNIPSSFETLVPGLTYEKDRKVLEKAKEETKTWYDKAAKKRPDFQAGQTVWFKKNPKEQTWIHGKVIDKTGQPRSYVVESKDGRKYRRNEIHVTARENLVQRATQTVNPSSFISISQPKLVHTNLDDFSTQFNPIAADPTVNSPINCSESLSQAHRVFSRSGRLIKKPDRFY